MKIKTKKSQLAIRFWLILSANCLSSYAFTSSGDALTGTNANLIATLDTPGTARKYPYLVKGVTAISTYIKMKNLITISAALGIKVLFNILYSVIIRTMDETFVFLTPFSLEFFLFNAPITGVLFGIIFLLILKKIKYNAANNLSSHITIWYFLPFAIYKPTALSYIKQNFEQAIRDHLAT